MPKVSRYVTTLNKAQQDALKQLYERNPICPQPDGTPSRLIDGKPTTYRQFRKSVHYNTLMDCALVRWAGMTVGIEPDGYTHS